MNVTARNVSAGLLIAAIAGLSGWVLAISERVKAVETTLPAHQYRIESLESGRTTPISAEATARLNSLTQQIAELRGDVKDLAKGQAQIMDRILDGRLRNGEVFKEPPSIGLVKPKARGG